MNQKPPEFPKHHLYVLGLIGFFLFMHLITGN